jgi:hypothetical protein
MNDRPQDQDWRILAEQAAEEKDPTKLMEIIRALTRALDEQERSDAAIGVKHKYSLSQLSPPGDRARVSAGRPNTRSATPK